MEVLVTGGSGAAIIEEGDPTLAVVDIGEARHCSVGGAETSEMRGALVDEESTTIIVTDA